MEGADRIEFRIRIRIGAIGRIVPCGALRHGRRQSASQYSNRGTLGELGSLR